MANKMQKAFKVAMSRHDALAAMVKAHRDHYAAVEVEKRFHDTRDNIGDPDEATELRAAEASEHVMEMQKAFEVAVNTFVEAATAYRAYFPRTNSNHLWVSDRI
jgi:hypothetical protein